MVSRQSKEKGNREMTQKTKNARRPIGITIPAILLLLCSSCRCSGGKPVPEAAPTQATADGDGLQAEGAPSSASAADITDMIVVDQIGYRPNSDKWFMIKNPKIGYDSDKTYVPGASVQLRRSADNSVVKEILLTPWNGGEVDKDFSGDQVWQGQFSSVTENGTYHIFDPKNARRSYDFVIGDKIYRPVLDASLKSFFYQRSNVEVLPEYGGKWTHEMDHVQQKTAHLYDHSKGGDQGEETARDISGGWYDAGDYNRYTSWMSPIIWDLAYALEWYPQSFSDNSGIPESGNGVPDILDEVRVELEWMRKMQRTDGALYSGCFVVKQFPAKLSRGEGDPSKDDRPYFYANVSTAATASGAAAFAIGARHFRAFEKAYPGYADQLQKAAETAWSYLAANPKNLQYDHTDFEVTDANKDDGADLRLRVLAAAELFRLTGKPAYKAFVDAKYNSPETSQNKHQPIISKMFDTGLSLDLQRGMVSYSLAPNATPSVVDAIKESLRNGIEWVIVNPDETKKCPYLAYVYPEHFHWGSNGARAGWGNIIEYGIALKVNPERLEDYKRVAEEHLHYFHGRNATGYCYLTQSQLFGADKPITQIFHFWFHDGTAYDTNPAPGYLSGGPNRYFSLHSELRKIVPPEEQPPMKSYKDWNTSWPENSWEITENSTSYQSRHVLLTAAFAGNP